MNGIGVLQKGAPQRRIHEVHAGLAHEDLSLPSEYNQATLRPPWPQDGLSNMHTVVPTFMTELGNTETAAQHPIGG